MVRGNSEFVLEKDELVNMEQAMKEEVDEEVLNSLRANLFDIHRRIEDILYNTKLAVGQDISPEKLSKINNMVLELEKSTMNLGAEVSDGEGRDKTQQNDI